MALWFKNSALELNVPKTKELCCWGHRTSDAPHHLSGPLLLEGQVVGWVDVFKYLGTDIDHHLSVARHADSIYKKDQQRLR